MIHWALVVVQSVLAAFGTYHLTRMAWFWKYRRTAHRLVFETYTDGSLWRCNGNFLPASWLTAGLQLHMAGKPIPPIWVYQSNVDHTEGQLCPFHMAGSDDKDTDGRVYTFRHAFLADDFEDAKRHVEELKFGILRQGSARPASLSN